MSYQPKNYKADGGDTQVFGGKVVPSTGTQASAITAAKVDYGTGDVDDTTKLAAAFNASNGKINDILVALRGVGIIAS